MLIYSAIKVLDGDTVTIKLWPSGVCEKCRLEGLDTDELGRERGEQQAQILAYFSYRSMFRPYIVGRYSSSELGRSKKRDKYGRWLVRMYVWRYFRYVDYATFMKQRNFVKKDSQWNN